jgi:UDP-glucose 4-epimerase
MNQTPTVLVTGAEGLLGRHIVRALVDTDTCQVTAVSRMAVWPATKCLTWVNADLRQASEVQEMASLKADVIIHAAAMLPRTLDDAAAAEANHAMDDHMLLLARQSGASLIYMSSLSVYEDCDTPWDESLAVHPVAAYAASKHQSERAIQALGLPAATLRISSPYSASDITRPGVLYHFAREAVAGRPLIVTGKGERAQDFVHGADIGRAVVAVLQHWREHAAGARAETFNIAAGHPISMTELAELVVSCCGSGDLVHDGVEDGPPYRAELSVARAKEILRWQPQVELRAGLEQLIRHMRGSHEDWLVV